MDIELRIPAIGESINEVEIGAWLKAKGDTVKKDEALVSLESEKATLELPCPAAGILVEILKQKGEVAKVGELVGYLRVDSTSGNRETTAPASPAPAEGEPKTNAAPESQDRPPESRVMPAAQRIIKEHSLDSAHITPTGPGGRILKEDALRAVEQKRSKATEPTTEPDLAPSTTSSTIPAPTLAAGAQAGKETRQEEAVPMSRMRRTIAQRLLEAQQTAALLTTFNEVDMTAVLALRKEFGETFQKKHQVKLGFMSFFVKACIDALKLSPALNAEVRDNNIVFRNFYDIGVAVGSGKGLVVPVLRDAERLSFAEIEMAIASFGQRAKENKLSLAELQGGTFTISNGGVYGSLLSTPIVNPPQSGVLGMHAIQERPVARDGQVVIRPMMYLALTYDHRIVDGREAVTFLRRIKEVLENPARMLMEI
jgi:2-oxoglutarate dehydrogenase E2 component (dihydrolipoamide succinyltransferase)